MQDLNQITEPQPKEDEAEPQTATETGARHEATGRNIDAIFGVKLDVRVVLGRAKLPISEILNLSKGSVIELDRKVGDPVDIMVNDRMVARGDLVKVRGGMIGVALREIVKDFVTD